MNNKIYDILIIGGGISGCVFASNFRRGNSTSKLALIEAGIGLGGRSSSRISDKFNGWELNHGSPNLNILNEGNNNLLKNFIDELIKKKIITSDDSDLIKLTNKPKVDSIKNLEFFSGNNYISCDSMRKLSQNIISLNNIRNNIDFYFQTLIVEMEFNKNHWYLRSKNGEMFICKYLICASNLLLHKRSMEILNVNQIPLRKAIPKNKDKKIDLIFNFLERQSFIPRLTFLIYTENDYYYKDNYCKKFRYFHLGNDLEHKFKFEKIVFQLQKDNKLGIVIHTKNFDFINEYLEIYKEDIFKRNILNRFNEIFEGNTFISPLSGNEDVSIMRWRASQPFGVAVPISLQICRKYKIGFCGDWFDEEGFGRIEGAILSGLRLATKFKNLI